MAVLLYQDLTTIVLAAKSPTRRLSSLAITKMRPSKYRPIPSTNRSIFRINDCRKVMWSPFLATTSVPATNFPGVFPTNASSTEKTKKHIREPDNHTHPETCIATWVSTELDGSPDSGTVVE